MEFFADTSVRPSELPVVARELWHRDAWDQEQRELAELTGVCQITDELIPGDVFRAIYATA